MTGKPFTFPVEGPVPDDIPAGGFGRGCHGQGDEDMVHTRVGFPMKVMVIALLVLVAFSLPAGAATLSVPNVTMHQITWKQALLNRTNNHTIAPDQAALLRDGHLISARAALMRESGPKISNPAVLLAGFHNPLIDILQFLEQIADELNPASSLL